MSSQIANIDFNNNELLARCCSAKSIAILTGAGISAESGLSTFRGSEGIWSKFRPEELANMDAFLRNPERVWEWYQYRRDVLDSAKPNPAHIALATWERLSSDFTLITQNVDGLHQAAGSQNIIELHGNLKVNRCLECGAESDMENIRFAGRVPVCECGGLLRPGVVWFGEMLPEAAISEAFAVSKSCDLFVVVGTSAVVYPAASLPEIAKDYGASIIEINPEPTSISRWADFVLSHNAGDVLPQLVDAVAARLNTINQAN